MNALLGIGFRWIHIASVVVLLGSVFYARVVVGELSARFKPVAYMAVGGILVSGLYNLLSKVSPPPYYHAWVGIKVLLALHVFAATLFYRGKLRALTGVLITGAIILAISGYLRWISLL